MGGCKRGIATRMSQRRTPPTSADERTTSAYQRSTYTNPTALFRATSRFQIASNIYSNIMCSHILHSISCRGRPLSFHSLAHSNPHEESFSKKAWNPEKYLPTKFPRLFPRHCRALRPTLMAATIPGRQTRAALSLISRGRRTTGTDSPGEIPFCVFTVLVPVITLGVRP